MDAFFEIVESSEPTRTIKKPVAVTGKAFRWFSGKTTVTFLPSDKQGLVFKIAGESVAVAPQNVCFDEKHCTTLRTATADVRETEHVLSAVYGLGITNLIIELDNVAEPPIMDGSAQPFVEALLQAGLHDLNQKKRELVITRNFRFGLPQGDSFIEVKPSDAWSVAMDVEYAPPIGKQSISLGITPETYSQEVSFARAHCAVQLVTLHLNSCVSGLWGTRRTKTQSFCIQKRSILAHYGQRTKSCDIKF
jgi:UDP-3-O-[3-hydroxymyristoyl] N-acetylglucosamine deacetylase